MIYYKVTCFWCEKEMSQRQDTYQRQKLKYSHHCCRKCFGKEPSFKAKRSAAMIRNNPFKGKTHSDKTKRQLSKLKMGTRAWNKGLTKQSHPSIKKYGESVSLAKTGKSRGANNPNWKGGISERNYHKLYNFVPSKWKKFRQEILKRDVFNCWKCQSQNRLEVHHMAGRKNHPALQYDEFNCIVLCHNCHKQFHKKYGRKKFHPGHTEIFLNEGRSPDNYVMFH